MDRSVAWRAALVQALSVAVLSAVLALLLPRSFFEDWGWLSGPSAWLACAALTARVLALPLGPALGAAVLSGVPSLLFVVAGVHWLGAAVAILVFALWCGALGARYGRRADSTFVGSRNVDAAVAGAKSNPSRSR